ncbi:thioredoxin, putative [Babesia bigemina]|uniref:Thioredoxin, putative n=1 Tax=Babesia bigemina TaxID=5866 RepID=A0A061D4J7_BABBI|nr:thioredoxin, putative [Babesia bigemina]CDR95646.1 thioredoxin, putative [Babesia bigemina]|eukprot:XP_012767832.1 thioredoxin, putative [Babesia bigemina]
MVALCGTRSVVLLGSALLLSSTYISEGSAFFFGGEQKKEPRRLPPNVRIYNKSNGASFDEMIENNKKDGGILIVDFFAEWCRPCRQFKATLTDVAERYLRDNLLILQVDIEQEEDLAATHKVSMLPTMIIFKGGEPVKRMSGAAGFEDMVQLIDEVKNMGKEATEAVSEPAKQQKTEEVIEKTETQQTEAEMQSIEEVIEKTETQQTEAKKAPKVKTAKGPKPGKKGQHGKKTKNVKKQNK